MLIVTLQSVVSNIQAHFSYNTLKYQGKKLGDGKWGQIELLFVL